MPRRAGIRKVVHGSGREVEQSREKQVGEGGRGQAKFCVNTGRRGWGRRPSRARGVDEGRQGVDLNFVYCHARFLFMVPVFLRPMSVNFFLLLSCLLAFFFRSIVNPLPQCMQRHIRFINSCFIHVFALFLVHLAKRNSLSCPASTVILCCNARFFILFLRHHLISIVYGI